MSWTKAGGKSQRRRRMDGGAARQVYCAPQRHWEEPRIHPFLTKTNGKNAKTKTTNTTTIRWSNSTIKDCWCFYFSAPHLISPRLIQITSPETPLSTSLWPIVSQIATFGEEEMWEALRQLIWGKNSQKRLRRMVWYPLIVAMAINCADFAATKKRCCSTAVQ